MRIRRLSYLFICTAILGCDRNPSAPKAVAPATTNPAPIAMTPSTPPLATMPIASTEPTPAIVMIDDQRIEFPPAKLRLQLRDDKVSALLMSDDPPSAINPGYTGNSFYIEMTIDDVDDISNVPGAVVMYQSPQSTERLDSPNGIFLEGGRKQLQPQQVKVEFESAGAKMAVRITGNFTLFDTQDETIPPRQVPVTARLLATVKK